ncbi:MAG: hypothetical protein WCF99_08505 [Chloroflexales bacterium]
MRYGAFAIIVIYLIPPLARPAQHLCANDYCRQRLSHRLRETSAMTNPGSERNRILKMIESGQVSADEAAHLLDAIGPAPRPADRQRSRLVRVRVTNLHTGRQTANVTIPVSLVNVGLRLGARLAPHLSGSDVEALIHGIEGGASGRLLEWQDLEEGERVELIVEMTA